ncbi:C2 domain containing protein, partial [Melia azedarach]
STSVLLLSSVAKHPLDHWSETLRKRRKKEKGRNFLSLIDSLSAMENLMGLLRIHVLRGVNLAVRDVSSSDPYAVIKMGKQKLKTRVVKQNVNPEWNEDLTLSISVPKSSSQAYSL